MKKKIFAILIMLCVAGNVPVFAQSKDEALNEKLASIGFRKLFAVDDKAQIEKMFENFNKSSNKHNLNKIYSFYDEKYVNSDGFDYNSYFELIKQTWNMYPDMAYNLTIKSITVNGDNAIVQTYETAEGNAKDASEYLDDNGKLESKSEVIYFLKKMGNRWLIISDSVISEKVFIKYGDAKEIVFDIIAPAMAVAGEEYSVLFSADMEKNRILLGSITNEKITYPSERPKEVFRKLGEDGILERFVVANNDGYNEQAVVSVGITKAEVSESMTMKLSVSGVAFLMSRVNVVQSKKFNVNGQVNEEKTEL